MRRGVLGFVLGAFALLVAGCVAGPSVDGTAALSPGGDDSYFVIGAEPDHVQIVITRGDMENGLFAPDGWARPAYASFAENGYLVGKMHGGDTLGVVELFYHASRDAFLTTPYIPCGPAKILSFQARPGTVVYLTHMRINRSGDGLLPAYHDDYAAAQAFMKLHFPLIADKLERGTYKLLLTTNSCQN